MKAKVTLLIDSETVQKAKEIGINLSKASEYALSQMINAIESVDFQNNERKHENRRFLQVDRAGFEPAASTLRMWRSYQTEPPARLSF